jgi:hypothetical protein
MRSRQAVPLPPRRHLLAGIGLTALTLVLSGCSKPPTPRPEVEDHLGKVAMLYNKFSRDPNHKGRPPKDGDELKKWAQSLGAEKLKSEYKIDNLDEAFISPRDKQPYTIIGGVSGMGPPPGVGGAPGGGSGGPNRPGAGVAGGPPPIPKERSKPPVIAYEKVGLNGKRYVVMLMGSGVTEVDDEGFKKMVPDAK